MKKFFLVSVALLSAQNVLAAHSEFKIGITQEFENLNPIIMTMAATNYLHRIVNRSLVVENADNKWVTQLAKSMPTLENKQAKLKDGKIEATWEIKTEAKWGDGVPVTCEDFAFAREVALSPTVAVQEKDIYSQIEKIEIDPKNPKKCVFVFSKARWDFNRMAQYYPLPKHLEEPVFKKYSGQKEGYERNSLYVQNPTNPGLYNGPYVVTEVEQGSHISFAPNPHFYGVKPKLSKVIVKLIPNTGTLEANLRSGNIDSISSMGFTFDQALAFEKKVKAENLPYVVLFKPSQNFEHIAFNLDNPILKDLKVRKALAFATNKIDLAKALFEGKQIPALHFIAPQDPWYTDDPKKITLYNYSLDQANKLLDEAGWKKTGEYRTKDGQKLSFQILTTAGNKTRELVEVYLKEQWKKVGVELIIKNEPARTMFGETMRKRLFPAIAMFAWTSSSESNPRSTYHSGNIPSEKNAFSGQNFYGWRNAKVDQLIDSIDTSFKNTDRLQKIHEILKYYTDELPGIPLFNKSDMAVIPATMKGFRLTGHQFMETNDIENWEWP